MAVTKTKKSLSAQMRERLASIKPIPGEPDSLSLTELGWVLFRSYDSAHNGYERGEFHGIKNGGRLLFSRAEAERAIEAIEEQE